MSGIYQIRNLINGKIYIGSAVNIKRRWYDHIYQLNKKNHSSSHLQRSWDKYGKDNFVFEILEEILDKTKLVEREQHYIDDLKSFEIKLGYNICKIAGSWLGMKHSEETKDKLRKICTGRKHTEEEKQKMRDNHPHLSPSKGCKHSEESIMKRVKNFKKNYKKENHAFYNKKLSENHIKNLSIALSGENNPMFKKSVFDILAEKYGIEEATIRWKDINQKRSISGKGKNIKSVIQFDKEGNFIKDFNSMIEAFLETGTSVSGISNCCNGRSKKSNGFQWKFKNINNL